MTPAVQHPAVIYGQGIRYAATCLLQAGRRKLEFRKAAPEY